MYNETKENLKGVYIMKLKALAAKVAMEQECNSLKNRIIEIHTGEVLDNSSLDIELTEIIDQINEINETFDALIDLCIDITELKPIRKNLDRRRA